MDHSANGDTGVHIPVEADIADGTTVDTPAMGLELLDDLHRPQFGSAGNRPSRKTGTQQTEGVLLFCQQAMHCADQMMDLEKNIQRLNDTDTVALGISVDSIPSKKAWAESLGATNVEFLSDFEPKGEVIKKYNIWHRGGFSERAVFVVDKKGVIRFAKVYPTKQKPDFEEFFEVLSVINNM